MDNNTPYMTYHRRAIRAPYAYAFINNKINKINNKNEIDYKNILSTICLFILMLVIIIQFDNLLKL